jgi:iron complex outermembrane receptor protein
MLILRSSLNGTTQSFLIVALLVVLASGPAAAQEATSPAPAAEAPPPPDATAPEVADPSDDSIAPDSAAASIEGEESLDAMAEEEGMLVPRSSTPSQTVVVVGSRLNPRTDTESPTPVDVVTAEQIQATGVNELGQALQRLAPSFNFSTTTVSDGSDLIRPATLRGLAPDQLLVLVNGKRRHQMALVNVQETIGKGSAGYDLNAIPMAAVERIEVLRDGAAAIYGSDAIAGVINIVLKENTGLQVEANAGRYYDSDSNVWGALDTFQASINGGIPLGDKGVFNATLSYRERGLVNRAGVATLESSGGQLIGDWYKDGKAVRRLRIGDSGTKGLSAFYNADYDLTKSVTIYSFGGYSVSQGESSGFFRGPGHPRVPAQLYPDGFLPTLITRSDDFSVVAGLRSDLGTHWKLDVSGGWGQSKFGFGSRNSVNVSWYYEPTASGAPRLQSPTSADAGTLLSRQLTANVDLTARYDSWWNNPILFAVGAAYRLDGYEIKAGDPVSYTYGRANDPSIDIINPTSQPMPAPAEAGIQGFPGFSPATEVNEMRPSLAAYADAETDFTKIWMVGLATRFESIDFKDQSLMGKVTTRIAPVDFFSMRGTVSNGFRAPGVQQLYYSQTLTNLVNGQLVETGTVPNNSPIARRFEIDSLKPERSIGASAGIVFTPDVWTPKWTRALSLTADLFGIQIRDRIVLSESISGDGNPAVQEILDANRLGAAQFFTNAVDTTTYGTDIVGTWEMTLSSLISLDLQAALSLVKTQVDDVNSQSTLISDETLFSETQRLRLERGQPRERTVLSARTGIGDVSVRIAGNHFGPVSGRAFTNMKKTWSGKWLTDLSVMYRPQVLKGFGATLGANNLFNVRPDKWGTQGGIYSEAGFTYGWETLPFGINGGYYYANLSYTY